MTDVRDEVAGAATNDNGQAKGAGFIWYELMTPDPDAAKAFYDKVVGWNIEAKSNFPNGYRMIGRSDGKFAGGVLPLTPEMQQHGARPSRTAARHSWGPSTSPTSAASRWSQTPQALPST